MFFVAGSYERFIWGFRLKPNSSSLAQLFSYPSHISPITTVAAAGPAAASGSSDDTIHIYDLPSAASLGPLEHLSSTITALTFYAPPNLSLPRNLISAAADGSVSIFDTDPYVLLKSFRVHKKGINDLAVHPSGKLALTVSRDGCLGMSNLMRGKRSFACRLPKEASVVKFDWKGETFFMVSEEKTGIHEAEDARLIMELDSQKRVLCAAPGQSGILFTAGEDRNITAWDTYSGKVAHCTKDAHTARIKGLVVLPWTGDDPYVVASASSDGFIRVWDVRVSSEGKPNPLAEGNTKSRLTCLAASSLKRLKQQEVGSNGEEEEEEEEEAAVENL